MKKITKKENFNTIKGILEELGRKDLVEVMAHEIELIEKKASKGKLTKTQVENEGIKALILKVLKASDKPKSITELLNSNSELSQAVGNSNQKLSALMTQLKNANKVVRTQDGKKAVFSLAVDFEEEETIEESEEVESL